MPLDSLPAATVIIVHGAFADGSSWDRVIPLLQDKGIEVMAVQNPLTSLGEDLAATRRAIAAAVGDVVLVGHSWGGMVITEAGTDDQVAALVYVAAFAPDAGQSVADLGKDRPPPPGIQRLVADSDGFLRLTAEAVAEDFAQDLPRWQTALLAATQGPIAAAAFSQRLTAAAWRHKPCWYVVATDDRMIDPDLEREWAKAMRARTTELATSHVPMLSQPEKVAAVIAEAVRAVESQSLESITPR